MSSLRTPLFRRVGDQQGAQLVEFALVFPIVLLVTAGIIDVGLLLKDYQVVTNAAREGARLGAVQGGAAAAITARVNGYLAAGGLQGSATTDVQQVLVPNPSGPSVPAVRVVVAYPYEYLVLAPVATLLAADSIPASVTLRAGVTMRREAVAAP
jgi:Flp pilus assembly protein TadG